MTRKTEADSAKSELLIAIARDLIRESGDFELSMRELAARAQVSLRTPYVIFGSKAGLISAILRADQAVYREKLRALPRGDAFHDLFKSLTTGVAFYAESQPFYRALFRETHAYPEKGETEPARENPDRFVRTCRRRSLCAGRDAARHLRGQCPDLGGQQLRRPVRRAAGWVRLVRRAGRRRRGVSRGADASQDAGLPDYARGFRGTAARGAGWRLGARERVSAPLTKVTCYHLLLNSVVRLGLVPLFAHRLVSGKASKICR